MELIRKSGPSATDVFRVYAAGQMQMAKAYYSAVLEHTADQVWTTIRIFHQCKWAGVACSPADQKQPGVRLGAIRRITMGDHQIYQRLLAHCDLDRFYTYGCWGPSLSPFCNVQSTIRVYAIVESGKAFVEWSASFECPTSDFYGRIDYFEKDYFAKSAISLRSFMAARNAERLLHPPIAASGSRIPGHHTDRAGRVILRLV
jgi:hypothetical protein